MMNEQKHHILIFDVSDFLPQDLLYVSNTFTSKNTVMWGEYKKTVSHSIIILRMKDFIPWEIMWESESTTNWW